MKHVIVIDSGMVDGIEVFSSLEKAYKVYSQWENEHKSLYDVKSSIEEEGAFVHISRTWDTRILKRKIN